MAAVTGPAAEALERSRQRLNARFALARKSGAGIDPATFLEHLSSCVAPLVNAIASRLPDRTTAATESLFDVSLELFAASMLGPAAKSPAVRAVWTGLLPTVPVELLARDPRQVAASFSNAAANISGTAGARPHDWLTRMAALAPACTNIKELIECGKIVAWQSGMVQYRAGALAAARALPSQLRAAAVGLAPGLSEDANEAALNRMAADPWLKPSAATQELPRRLGQVARVGTFRGLGGPFLRPPTAWVSSGQIHVSDGEDLWRLLADCHGSLFARASERPTPERPVAGVNVTRHGELTWDSDRIQSPALAGAGSAVCDGTTIAVTLPTSHHVYLFARTTASATDGGRLRA